MKKIILTALLLIAPIGVFAEPTSGMGVYDVEPLGMAGGFHFYLAKANVCGRYPSVSSRVEEVISDNVYIRVKAIGKRCGATESPIKAEFQFSPDHQIREIGYDPNLVNVYFRY